MFFKTRSQGSISKEFRSGPYHDLRDFRVMDHAMKDHTQHSSGIADYRRITFFGMAALIAGCLAPAHAFADDNTTTPASASNAPRDRAITTAAGSL
jgi:hypothetical protein